MTGPFTCANPQCGKQHNYERPSGWCDACYRRWLYHDRPDTGPPLPDTRRPGGGQATVDGVRREFEARYATFLELVAKGYRDPQIARAMGVTERTVCRYQSMREPRLSYEERYAEFRRMTQAGEGAVAIARKLGIGPRAVQGYRSRAKAEGWL